MQEPDDLMPVAIFRTLAQNAGPGKVANPNCASEGCKRTTREGKPYCSDHVEMGTYVKKVLRELELRNSESVLLEDGKNIEPSGHLVRETLLMLEQGSYTEAKLARLMDISHRAASQLIKQMHQNGLARIGHTDRGALTVYKLDDKQKKLKKRRFR